MSLTWIPALTAKVVGALDRRRLPRTIGAIAASLVLVAIVVISLVGDGDDAEPKQVMKLEQLPRTGVGGPITDAPVPALSTIALGGADASLVEMSDLGPLPRIGPDGRKPMAVYARAYDRATAARARVAVVIGGLGFGKALTDAVLERLPADVSLAFAPQGSAISTDIAAARAKGHEVLLEIPMESGEKPTTSTGLHTLTINADKKNARRMQWLMSRATGYAGLINTYGDSFLATKDEAIFVMAETAKRGLFFVEAGGSAESLAPLAAGKMGTPFVRADSIIDKKPGREEIDAALASLEAFAKKRGVAIGVAGALPNTVDRVAAWIATLEQKGIALVPVSAIAETAAVEALPIADVTAKPAPVAKPRVTTKPRLSSKPRTQTRTTPPKRVRKPVTTPKPAADPAPESSTPTSAPHP